MQLTANWDKTFAKSDKVDHQKVTFKNRYGITLVGDLYLPKDRANRRLAAIAVGGPFGAVKEQSSGLYAQTMAERGFVTLAFDASYTGESGGEPRNVASPDINTEDVSATPVKVQVLVQPGDTGVDAPPIGQRIGAPSVETVSLPVHPIADLERKHRCAGAFDSP